MYSTPAPMDCHSVMAVGEATVATVGGSRVTSGVTALGVGAGATVVAGAGTTRVGVDGPQAGNASRPAHRLITMRARCFMRGMLLQYQPPRIFQDALHFVGELGAFRAIRHAMIAGQRDVHDV